MDHISMRLRNAMVNSTALSICFPSLNFIVLITTTIGGEPRLWNPRMTRWSYSYRIPTDRRLHPTDGELFYPPLGGDFNLLPLFPYKNGRCEQCPLGPFNNPYTSGLAPKIEFPIESFKGLF
jgi:hypothetical protein